MNYTLNNSRSEVLPPSPYSGYTFYVFTINLISTDES